MFIIPLQISTTITDRHVANDAVDDIGRHMLCIVPWSCDQPNTELGLQQAAISREGQTGGGVYGVSQVAA